MNFSKRPVCVLQKRVPLSTDAQILVKLRGAFVLIAKLEVRGSAKLEKLDDYLREIWLECCGHLSHFAFDGWQGEELNMKKALRRCLTRMRR